VPLLRSKESLTANSILFHLDYQPSEGSARKLHQTKSIVSAKLPDGSVSDRTTWYSWCLCTMSGRMPRERGGTRDNICADPGKLAAVLVVVYPLGSVRLRSKGRQPSELTILADLPGADKHRPRCTSARSASSPCRRYEGRASTYGHNSGCSGHYKFWKFCAKDSEKVTV
jgi:hypothetical protein